MPKARRCIVAIVALSTLAAPAVLAAVRAASPATPPARTEVDAALPVPLAVPVVPHASGSAPGPAVLVGDAVPGPSTGTSAAPAPSPPPGPPPPSFADRFPAQARATQDPSIPATSHWAVLIGINEHSELISDNVGSRQDAEDIRAHLLASGWLDDHILLLTDHAATRDNIVDGLRWLADRSDPSSTVVFHYSGHSKVWYGEDADGDGEVTDEGLWPVDDRYITDAELVSLLDPVDAGRAWFSFGTCNAAGFADVGLARPGRVLTFSSGEPQRSYEHPGWGNSVWVFLMVEEGMRAAAADLDGDRRVTVEEAWTWARPRARQETEGQAEGPQDAVIVDQVDGELDLTVPGAQPPVAQPSSRPATSPPAAPAPAPTREDLDRHGGYVCLLCG